MTLEHLHQVCELLKKESEKLQTQVGKQEEENGHLTHDVYNLRNDLNRYRSSFFSKPLLLKLYSSAAKTVFLRC